MNVVPPAGLEFLDCRENFLWNEDAIVGLLTTTDLLFDPQNKLPLTAEDINLCVGVEATDVPITTGLHPTVVLNNVYAVIEIDGDPGMTFTHATGLGINFVDNGAGGLIATITPFTYIDLPFELTTLTATNAGTYEYAVSIYHIDDILVTTDTATISVAPCSILSLTPGFTFLTGTNTEVGCNSTGGDNDFGIKTIPGSLEDVKAVAEIILDDPAAAAAFELWWWPEVYLTGDFNGPIAFDPTTGIAEFDPNAIAFQGGFFLRDTSSYFRILNNNNTGADVTFTITIKLYEALGGAGVFDKGDLFDEMVLPAVTVPDCAQALTLTAENIVLSSCTTAMDVTVTSGLLAGAYVSDLTAVVVIEGNPMLSNVTHPILGTLTFTYDGTLTTDTIHDFTYTDIPLEMGTLQAANVGVYNYVIKIYDGTTLLVTTSNTATLTVNPPSFLQIAAQTITVTAGVPAADVLVVEPITQCVYWSGLKAMVTILGNPMLSNVTHPVFGTLDFQFDGTNTTVTIDPFTYTDIDLVLSTLTAAHVGCYPYTVELFDGSVSISSSNNYLNVSAPDPLLLTANDITVRVNTVATDVPVITDLSPGVWYSDMKAVIEIYGGDPDLTATHDILNINFVPKAGAPEPTMMAEIDPFTYVDIDLVLNTLVATNPGDYTYKVFLYGTTCSFTPTSAISSIGLVAESNVANLYVTTIVLTANDIEVDATIEAYDILVISDTEGDDIPGLNAKIEITGDPGLVNVYHTVLGDIDFIYDAGTNTTTALIPNFTYTEYDLVIDKLTAMNIGTYPYTISVYEGTVFLAASSAVLKVNIPPCPTSIMDAANNIEYEVVTLAGRCWYAENVRGALYQDGSTIPFAKSYNNDAANEATFGLLYTYASATDNEICPAGWRLPSVSEWLLLGAYSASDLYQKPYWLEPNGYTNSTEFSLRGAGIYNGDAQRFENLLGATAFWTSDPPATNTAMSAVFTYYCINVEIKDAKLNNALSVRCIRDM
jgi:uncharacterized protein (TIGR02145 family)